MPYRSPLTKLAKAQRNQPSNAERKLWMRLRTRQLQGVRFRRQQLIGSYIVDFCSFEPNLIMEVDGGQHAERADADSVRSDFLVRSGYRILRFWNNEVLGNLDGVVARIDEELLALTAKAEKK